jgi:hypothetical protein
VESLNQYLETRLEASAISLDEFRELMVRLLNYGILCRDENQTERELFDRFLRVEEPAREFFSMYGINIHLDRRFEYLRLLPPGTQIPGMESAVEQAFSGSLRARLSQNEVAMLLVLRVQYDKALREGKLDEQGFVTESFESLGIAMKNLLGRPLPDKITERKRLFARLKQLRLIEFHQEDDIDSSESWLRIHPMIIDFVGGDSIAALQEGLAEFSEDNAEQDLIDIEIDAQIADEEADDVS